VVIWKLSREPKQVDAVEVTSGVSSRRQVCLEAALCRRAAPPQNIAL